MQVENTSSKKVACFGEILLRYSPAPDGAFISEASMPVYVGGAELNVATALALWQQPVSYITAMPQNFLADEIANFIRGKNIDITHVSRQGDRIGAYFLQQGKDLKNSSVIYDRAHSSFAELQPGMLNWDDILTGIDWFHFSAISPALNENVASVCLEAVKVATKKGIKISVDLNYREKLWKYGKPAVDVMPGLTEYCDVVMGNIWAAEKMLGISLSKDFDVTGSTEAAYILQATESVTEMRKRFPKIQTVANTFRFEKSGDIEYYATLHTQSKQAVSATHHARQVKDKIGSGDCFMAGLIYGLINGKQPVDVINFGAAAAVQKLQQVGDATTSSLKHINELVNEVTQNN